ncbi:uncharacterized protein LOC113674870 [Pocillopora damicornis]|uniref:uncharacterized protein LOC113674870 n=1 Tax=Pocillopora damicornis TaxID=46731 RepID=UPI000F554773|nr:uncharacterized protein LOC113674870 [Pocillopora damicornis]
MLKNYCKSRELLRLKVFFIWQLTPVARNNKKRRVRQLVAQSVEGLKEFEPIEIKFTVQGREVVIPLGHDAGDEKDNSTCRTTQHVLVAKDKGLISDEAYHELRMALPDEEREILPPISVLKQERNRQNGIIALYSIPEVSENKCTLF